MICEVWETKSEDEGRAAAGPHLCRRDWPLFEPSEPHTLFVSREREKEGRPELSPRLNTRGKKSLTLRSGLRYPNTTYDIEQEKKRGGNTPTSQTGPAVYDSGMSLFEPSSPAEQRKIQKQ